MKRKLEVAKKVAIALAQKPGSSAQIGNSENAEEPPPLREVVATAIEEKVFEDDAEFYD